MRFGSKGLDAPIIIGIILAVIIALAIFYILWIRGMLPFSAAADRNVCLAEIMSACHTGSINSNTEKGGGKVNKACLAIKDIRDMCQECINIGCSNGDSNLITCCGWISETARA